MLDSVSDDAFARYVKQTGMATPEQIDAARKETALPLAEALVKQGVITPVQRETVEKKLEAQREGVGELGGCRLLRKIGEGGMGAVYLAEDPDTKRKVAIKVLPKKHAADKEYLKRFNREIEAATKLDHPNIVQAYRAGEDRGYHYFVMEYCEGESLRKRIERLKGLPIDDACRVILQVAKGLQHAHAQGFIHRDVKPDNLMLTPSGAVKILDLGLAKNIEDTNASFRTVTGSALGTPHYISPEQARGDKNVDGRSDIYSLGATYYHVVTGQVPFPGSSIFEIIQKHLMENLPDPRDIKPEIPETVVQVLRKMLAKSADDRYKTCGELLQDLEQLTVKQKPLSKPLEASLSSIAMPTRSLPATAPRKPGLLLFAAAAAIIVVISSVLFWPSPKPQVVPEPPKKTAPVLAKKDPPKEEPAPLKVEPPKEQPKPPSEPPKEEPKPEPLKPELPKEEPKPEPTKPEPPKPDPVPPPAPVKRAKATVPSPLKMREAETALKERYKDDYAKKAPSDLIAAAKKFLAFEAPEDPASNYQRLLAARDFAAQGGDAATVLAAVDRIDDAFVVDPLPLKTDGIAASVSRTADGGAAIVAAALALADEAVQVDRYDLAARLSAKAKTVAEPLKNDELKAATAARDKSVLQLQKEFQAISAYAKTLAEKPEDPASNTQIGRFYCLVKEDWDRGLVMLAKGNDATLKGLAEKELSKSEDSAVQRDLCEGWLTLAERESKGLRKDTQTERARFWYTQVEEKLLPADKTKIAKRLETLEKAAGPKAPVAKKALKAPAIPAGGIDLLARVGQAVLERMRGAWRMQDGALLSPQDGNNMTPTLIHLPVQLQEEYDLYIEAQRTGGSEDIVFALSSGRNEFGMGLDGWAGEAAGLNGPGGQFNWRRSGPGRVFLDGKPHLLKFEVRRTGALLRVDDAATPTLEIRDYAQNSVPAAMGPGRQLGCVTIATVRSVYRITRAVVVPKR